MLWNFRDSAGTFLKIFLSLTLAWFFILGHIILVILAHVLIVAVSGSISLEAAITPLHTYIMADDWLGAYQLLRESLLIEIPLTEFLDALFGSHAHWSLGNLFYDLVKIATASLFSWLLCRFNLLISSKRHPILFGALSSYWTSISLFSSLILIAYLQTLPQQYLLGGVLLVVSVVLTSTLIHLSTKQSGLGIRVARIALEELRELVNEMLDGFFIYLVSCLAFDFLRNWIADTAMLVLAIAFLACILALFYQTLREQVYQSMNEQAHR